jgi:hypothetical protein
MLVVEALPPRVPYRFVDGPILLRAGRERLTDSVRLPLRWTITCKGKPLHSGETGEAMIGWPAEIDFGLYHVYSSMPRGLTRMSR